MNGFDRERFDHRIKWSLLLASVGTIVLLAVAALRENVYAPWRQIRLEYANILQEKATDPQGIELASAFEIGINQNVVPELAITDRCITCHTGLDDPRMADQPNPYRTHPGSFLSIHPPGRFGCTSCHQGQGLATEVDAAHGRVDFWLHPMLERDHMYSACTKCHREDTILGDDLPEVLAGDIRDSRAFGLLKRGRDLVREKGCLGCHELGGRGGTLGPDITFVGDKTAHEFDFSHFDKHAPRTVAHWLKQHFLDPAAVSPGTKMPPVTIDDDDATALTAYMLSLKRAPLQPAYRPGEAEDEQAPVQLSGHELYAQMCSACHGADGRMDESTTIRTPSLNNVDTLATCSDEYLRHIIENGRSGTAMPAWGAEDGNLTGAEIDRLVAHIRGWEPVPPDLTQISARIGNARMGAAVFSGFCANCHGNRGEGGIGNALNADTFLSVASDEFLADTIINGRPGTAMASWKHLPAQAVSDILAHMRSWEAEPPAWEDVSRALGAAVFHGDTKTGSILYRANCASCHGNEGEGGIGPRLNSPNILPIVDNEFLYQTMIEGRPGTAMPSWKHLSADAIGAIMAYMRSWSAGNVPVLETAPGRGDYALGELLYEVSCADCHGEHAEGGVGPALAHPATLGSLTDDVLYHWIARGRTGTAMEGFLAEEQGVTELSPAHIADVIAYLRHTVAQGTPPVLRTGIGDANVGRTVYTENCASCHGVDGEGASGPQLNNPNFLAAASDGFLAATIVLGRTGTPMQSMVHGQPGLGQIDPDRVQDVIAYIRRWDVEQPRRKPRAVAEMSRRAIASGGEKFARFCAGCHGPAGMGEMDGEEFFAPALNNREFLHAASDGFLLATIARGRSNTPMRPFGIGAGGIAELSAGDISDIVSYIRTWQTAYTQ